MPTSPPSEASNEPPLTRALLLHSAGWFWADITGIRGAPTPEILQWMPGSPRVEAGLVGAAVRSLPLDLTSTERPLSHFLVGLSPRGPLPSGSSAQLVLLVAMLWYWHATQQGLPILRPGERPTDDQPIRVITGSGSLGHSRSREALAGYIVEPVGDWPAKLAQLEAAVQGLPVQQIILLVPEEQTDVVQELLDRSPLAELTWLQEVSSVDELPERIARLGSFAPDTFDLGAQLRVTLERRRRVLIEGGDVRALDATLSVLRRRIRQGPQLVPGLRMGAGRYELIEEVGSGGFATVWRAMDDEQGRIVALKVLHHRWAEDRSRVAAFFRGAREMSRLRHPNVARIIEPRVREGPFHFFVMEYLGGGDLHEAVLSGERARDQLLRTLSQAGQALEYAHRNGLVHRDVKPQNILLDEMGVPRLVDFDLVRVMETDSGGRTGELGTFVYCAPEALAGGEAGPPADIYGLGVTAVFAVFGRELPPLALLRSPEDFIASLDCHDAVKRVLVRAVAVDPEARFPTVAELCSALIAALDAPPSDRYLSPTQRRGRRLRVAGALAMLILVVALVSTIALIRRERQSRWLREADQLYAAAVEVSSADPGAAFALVRAAGWLVEQLDLPQREAHARLLGQMLQRGAVQVIPGERPATAMAVSSDGDLLVAARRNLVETWDLHTGRSAAPATIRLNHPMEIALLPDERRALVWESLLRRGSQDQLLAWVVDLAQPDSSVGLPSLDGLYGVALSSAGDRLVTMGGDLILRVRSLSPLGVLESLPMPRSHPHLVRQPLAFDLEGEEILLGFADGSVARFPVGDEHKTARIVEVKRPAEWSPSQARGGFSLDSRVYALGHREGVRVTDTRTGEVLADLRGEGAQEFVRFGPRGARFATGRSSDTIDLWGLDPIRHVAALESHRGRVLPPAFSSDGRHMVSGGTDGRVVLWQAVDGVKLAEISGHQAGVTAVTTAQVDGRLLTLSADRGGEIRVWRPPPEVDAPHRATRGHAAPGASGVDYLGQPALYGVDGAGALVRWDPTTWEAHTLRGARPDLAPVAQLSLSPTGDLLALMYEDGELELIPIPGAGTTGRARLDNGRLRISPDAQHIGWVHEGRIQLFDASGQPTLRLPLNDEAIYRTLSWARDGRLIGATFDGPVHLLDPLSGALELVLDGSSPGASAMLQPAASDQLIIASWDAARGVTVWDLTTGRLLQTMEGHGAPVVGLDVSPDGTLLSTASWDNEAWIWELSNGERQIRLTGHQAEVLSARFSADGTRLVTAGADGTVLGWDVASGSPLERHPLGEDSPAFAWYAADGKSVLAATRDGWLHAWRAETEPYATAERIRDAAGFSNLRVCRGSGEVVPVLPFPDAASVWAPPERCATP